MRRGMYPRLALTNLKKNRQIYLPYLLTCICTIAMFYSMEFLALHPGLAKMTGGNTVQMIMKLGVAVIAIFSCVFLIYSNSFLTKKRKKELGLYNILGMEKRHIGKMLLWEQFYTVAASFLGGFGLGILGSKLMLLILLKLVDFPVPFGFWISWEGIGYSVILFGLIYALTLFLNIRQLHLVNPVQLLQGSGAGEREPKAKWFMALAGLVSLGVGYYLAVTTESILKALNVFFVAVILVMLGTYLLFTAGSIVILKAMRWKKSFYYKTSHFISVSGMIYRMKQNAAGLASICILSTGVLLMVSSTVSLYIGYEDILKNRYETDVRIVLYRVDGEEKETEIAEEIQRFAEERQVGLQDVQYYRSLWICARNGENGPEVSREKMSEVTDLDALCYLNVLPLSEYNRLTGLQETLEDGELLVCPEPEAGKDTFTIQDQEYAARKMKELPFKNEYGVDATQYYVAAEDEVVRYLDRLQMEARGEEGSQMAMNMKMNLDLPSDEEKAEFEKLLQNKVAEICKDMENLHISGYTDSRQVAREDFYVSYGGVFFLGMFLGTLFLLGTALIIYYKQVSEGYQDQKRFEIMQKVGLSRKEIQSSVKSQILQVFFLPLLMAMVHIAFAFPLIRRILQVFYMYNVKLYAVCTLATIGIFAVIYGMIYILTARTYYKIVK